MSALAASFIARWKGPTPAPAGELQAMLEEFLRLGQERWPGLSLEPAVFAEYLAERVPADTDPIAAMRRLRGEDLYLACGCAIGDPEAIRSFEEHLLSRVPGQIIQATRRPELVDETLQVLREKLFVGSHGGRPRIAQYAGQGALENWVRMAALRTALDLLDAEKPHDAIDATLHGVAATLSPGTDLELDYIKAHDREAFVSAFRETLGTLPERERNLLRYQYVEALTPERIGRIYGVHRTTAIRWVAAALEHLLEGIRRALMRQLQISEDECDSLVRLVRSRLPVTLHSLLDSSRS
jgi:RNA polymerase sigma-70 factor (ECF subfamily)